MKKRLILLVAVLITMSGCSTLINQATYKPVVTNNGTVIFSSTKDINKLCTKSSIDNFLAGQDANALAREYQITNYDDLLFNKIKNKYVSDLEYSDKCSYQVYYYDFVAEANWVEIAQLTYEKDEVLNINALNKDKKLDNFKNKKEVTVVEAIVQYMLKTSFSENDEINKSLSNETIQESGKYRLIAQPVYRIYHMSDTKLINDYDFSGIIGLNFKLEKIK